MTTPGNDVIDSRDIIDRLEALRDELETIELDDEMSKDSRKQAVAEWHDDNDDGKVDVSEFVGPKTIRLVRQ